MGTTSDALDPYSWSCSEGGCLAEG